MLRMLPASPTIAELICSRSRQRKPSEARAILSYLAVEETGYPAADVARFLGVK